MRRTGGFEYNDNFLIVQAPWVKSNYKVAIKIPCVYDQEDIRGLVVISTEEFPDSIEIPLNTSITIPKLISERMIYDDNVKFYHMKFGLKNPRRQDFKVCFRNKGAMSLNAEFLVEKAFTNSDLYDISVYPTCVVAQPNG